MGTPCFRIRQYRYIYIQVLKDLQITVLIYSLCKYSHKIFKISECEKLTIQEKLAPMNYNLST